MQEFREVELSVLGKPKWMMGSCSGNFQIAKNIPVQSRLQLSFAFLFISYLIQSNGPSPQLTGIDSMVCP